MTTVALPNGQTVEFPDGTPEAEMSSAIQSHLSEATTNRPGLKDYISNKVKQFKNLPDTLAEGADALLNETGGILSNAASLSTRNLRNAMDGTVKGVTGIVEGLGNSGNDLIRKAYPNTDVKDMTADPYIDKFFGLDKKQPGDALGQVLGQVGTGLLTGGETSESALAKMPKFSRAGQAAAETVLPKVENPEIVALKSKQADLDAEHQRSVDALNKAQTESKVSTGTSSPDTMEYAARKAEDDLTDLKRDNDAYHHQLENTGLPADLPPFDDSHIDELEKHKNNLDTANKAVDEHQGKIDQLENDLQTHDTGLDEFFDKNAEHDVNVARGLQEKHAAIEEDASEAYKDLENNIKKNVVPKKLDAGISSEIDKLQKANPNNPLLDLILNNAPTGVEKTANQILTAAKEFKSQRRALTYDLRSDPSFQSRVERTRIFDKTKALQEHVDRLLNDALGDHAIDLKNINEHYRNVIFPLRENPIIASANEKGRLSSNIAKDLRGQPLGQEGIGQQHVRDMIMNDPELLKNVIGQRYSANPKTVLNPNSTLKRLIDNHPEAKARIDARNEVNSNLQSLNNNKNQLIENQKSASENYKDAVKNASEIEQERAKAITSHATEKDAAIKTRETLNKTISVNQKKIDDLHARKTELEAQIPKLRAAATRKNQTLKQKMANSKALAAALKEQNSIPAKIKEAGRGFVSKVLRNKIKSLGIGALATGLGFGVKNTYSDN